MSRSELEHETDTRLIESVYRTVQQPETWNEFLRYLVSSVDGRSARILFMNRSADQVRHSIAVNHDEKFMAKYTDYYVNQCPWRPELALKKPGRLYSTYLDFNCHQQAFRQTEFYHDWARPQQIEHGMCGTVIQQADYTIQLLVQRTADAGHFSHQETSAINSLVVPHIRNAIQLTANIEKMRVEQQNITALGSRYPQPFALLDSALRVRYVSPVMEQYIGRSRGLRLKADQLRATQSRDNDHLYRLLRESAVAAMGKSRFAGASLNIIADADDRLTLRIVPCPAAAEAGLLPGNDAFVTVFLNADSVRLTLAAELLVTGYDLTRRECYLAMQLCNGRSLEQIAAHDGVSISTLRKQLKSIYQKTDTHRQGELISALLNSFAAVRG